MELFLYQQARNIMLHEDEAGDAITGLQQKTHYGRPRWSEVFQSLSTAHPKYVTIYVVLLLIDCSIAIYIPISIRL